ncbi:formylmethanofuran dehydrogenase subunit E [Methanomicrobium sp. W14]|jgi:formylmethanofuran dehydrogenase subunit E|uniref:FmdE family protein n=1 Tax=Methanomicrobium sp. W14 TaxID=2817839 RepID=UPI001AE50987|nr:FmdE family protein [Methanomicrobium sp. W14]MBP2133066.1 formylmethanofuran dehydrogenase subunit E [Methanomicrobium sp. W14]
MTQSIKSFDEAAEFHGHKCPGLAYGYKAAEYALKELSHGRSEDEELVAIVENDACGIDAIQFLTGCTIGKGNLIFRDYGKQVYTFIKRDNSDAVRLSQKEGTSMGDFDARTGELSEKVFGSSANDEERKEFFERRKVVIQKILDMPSEDLYRLEHVKPEIPERARLFKSYKCAKCGETVSESRARVQNGEIVCIPCFEEYSRGW